MSITIELKYVGNNRKGSAARAIKLQCCHWMDLNHHLLLGLEVASYYTTTCQKTRQKTFGM